MIWQPKTNQRVQFRYRKSLRPETGLHEISGRVFIVAAGPKTKNCLVRLPGGRRVVVPRGNLIEEVIN